MLVTRWVRWCLVLCFAWVSPVYAQTLVCGLATGFPPYQFQEQDRPAGFDVEVIRLIAKRTGLDIQLRQDKWDDVINFLRFGKIDCVIGMEINPLRTRYFDFTVDYYKRHDVVFVRADNPNVNRVEDLFSRVISGDRHSFVETYWRGLGIIQKMRVMQPESKEKAMQLLFDGRTEAAIMPRGVGVYLAKKLNLKVRILDSPDPGSPVAIAVKKGNVALQAMLNHGLQSLIKDGEIDRLYRQWF